jgi:nitroreductase
MNETTMSAYEAITTRRSVRRFLDRAVPPESVHQILRGAAQSPSGHNIQPWKVYVVSGVTKQKVTDSVLHAVANDPEEMHQPEFQYYPSNGSSRISGAAEMLDQGCTSASVLPATITKQGLDR